MSRNTDARSSARRGLTASLIGGLVAAPLAVVAATAPVAAAGPGLVISEVYGGGGNSGATLKNDFVELYNSGAEDVVLDGMSVQYRSSGGSGAATGVTPLSGTVAAGEHYLVQERAGSGGSVDLPTPDATGDIAMGGSSSTVFIAGTDTAIDPGTGSVVDNPDVVDLVGSDSNTFEGQAGPATSNTTSAARSADGTDTDDNATDLTTGAPTPVNSAGEEPTPAAECPAAPQTIADVQGDEDTSPCVGQTVTVQGVVTAAYPDGGFNGLYVQTGGTGGGTDATPGASDAVFVYGRNATPAGIEVGDSVEVTGAVSEYQGLTEITPSAGGVTELGSPLAPVTPLVAAYPTTDDAREAHEGELLAPTDELTVTNVYTTNQYAEIGLATGDQPLIQPTEVARPGTPEYDAVVADDAARAVTLDDGASINFLPYGGGDNQDIPLPWLSKDNPVRVGAQATLQEPVVLDYRNSTWKFQPTHQVTDEGTDVATFENTRPANAAPQDVGGDLKLGTFNVLNYFNTYGDVFEKHGGSCTYYEDRQGDPVTVDECTPDGPRGAAELGDFRRQQAKIVAAINAMDADIVSLEEIENSVKMLTETDRDDALKELTAALNRGAGSRRWAFAPTPDAADLPDLADQDVIRTAFIYNPGAVKLVGGSKVLVGDEDFDNAREPLAQAFKPVGTGDSEAFAVVVNHLKSKGCGDDADGDNADGPQGCYNGDRTRQAAKVAAFADDFAAEVGTDEVFLTGDFNAYTMEDPVVALEDAGYALVDSDTPGDYSYSFSGYSGSLDHVFANEAAQAMVTGADVWEINANEAIAFQYSRRNYNVTQFYENNQYAASDHNPEVVGLQLGEPATTQLNLIDINDFHGRIDANTTKFATTVEQLRQEGGEDDTLFVSAGDNIGASVFASSIQQDEPTIDVLNALDLRGSAVGNHELDKGFDDLTGRVSDRADWDYLGANIYEEGTEDPALPEYALYDVDGYTVGVIGAVTEETPSLVSPAGIEGLDFGDPVEAVNRVAGELSDGDPENGEADVLVATYHEGASMGTPDGATLEEEVAAGGAFADIVEDTSADVDVIFTGHTHKQYAWDGPVPGEPGATRPIIQTGSYGENIGQVELTLDNATGDVVDYTGRNVPRVGTEDLGYPRVQEVKQIVDDALDYAAEIGNQPVGNISADITTAFQGDERDDRAAESTLGDLVADALRDGVSDFADADLGITNPGGLRDELYYEGDTSENDQNVDGVVTYAEANAVLPFSNTVVLVDLTGADIEEILEQQWQTNPGGEAPSRPYLQLGLSDNVRVTADPSKPDGERITGVWIDDEQLDPSATYTVSTLSFLATGGDNFRAFTNGDSTDTGLLDAELWRDYLATGTESDPIAPDFARQQVFVDGLPATLPAGSTTSFDLGIPEGEAGAPLTGTTLDLTSLGAPANTSVSATLVDGGAETPLGDFDVTDGVASVELAVPAGASDGAVVRLVADPSGTTVTVPVGGPAEPETVTPDVVVKHKPARVRAGKTRAKLILRVSTDAGPARGYVRIKQGGTTWVRELNGNGRAAVRLNRFSKPGVRGVLVHYNGTPTVAATTVRHKIRVTG